MGPDIFSLTITHNEPLVRGFHRIVFAPQPALRYEAGQFLTLLRTIGGLPLRRSYSLLSAPGIDDAPQIGVRRIDNGAFSRFLCDEAGPGTVLQTTGAGGRFLLPPPGGARQLFLLAAGSGITPIYSLLRTAPLQRPELSLVLVYSNHDPSVTPLRAELEALAQQSGGRLHLHFLYSTNPDLRRARLNRDLLFRLLQEEHAGAHSLFYCCGPEAYMRFCTFVLREAGFAAERIRREAFIPAGTPLPPVAPPDPSPQEVVLYWQGHGWRFTVAWPETVLRAALRHGLELPYSCAAGRCASCVARCS
ncbi:MAG: ferredoxin--NADP reductase, partial [Chitinophagaceae bacterium]